MLPFLTAMNVTNCKNYFGVSERQRLKCCYWLALLLIFPSGATAEQIALTVYAGKYSDNRLGDVLLSKPVELIDSWLVAAAWSYANALENPRHQWEFEAQLAKHARGQSHWEVNALVVYRWKNFPWNQTLQTTLAVGEGLSYATETPLLEEASNTNVGAARLLNYILVEAAFAPPVVTDWSLVVRVHHRSGVFGLFDDVEGGSNIIAAGIKYYY